MCINSRPVDVIDGSSDEHCWRLNRFAGSPRPGRRSTGLSSISHILICAAYSESQKFEYSVITLPKLFAWLFAGHILNNSVPRSSATQQSVLCPFRSFRIWCLQNQWTVCYIAVILFPRIFACLYHLFDFTENFRLHHFKMFAYQSLLVTDFSQLLQVTYLKSNSGILTRFRREWLCAQTRLPRDCLPVTLVEWLYLDTSASVCASLSGYFSSKSFQILPSWFPPERSLDLKLFNIHLLSIVHPLIQYTLYSIQCTLYRIWLWTSDPKSKGLESEVQTNWLPVATE